MILWRLTCDHENRLAGSCINEEQYKKLYYLVRCFYEPITEDDRKIMIEVKNTTYCNTYNIEAILFWSEIGVVIFKEKVKTCVPNY